MKISTLILFFMLFATSVVAKPKSKVKVKFYNFDDLLVDGKVSKPKLLYVDSRQRVKFEKLLKLKKDFLPKLKETERDPALR